MKMKAIKGSKLIPTIFVGKWTVKVLFSLHERPYRHGQLRRRVGSVSQRMLTTTLRNLESTRLIARRVRARKLSLLSIL
jgi:DNA-binding HxlR family transcriptional regulator